MTPPTVPNPAGDWYDELQVAQPGDDQRGYPLLLLLGALAKPFEQLHDLVRDTDTGAGWSALFDPERAPSWALPWLAQAYGNDARGRTDEQIRFEARTLPRFQRGTPAAIIAAAAATLTGDKVVRLLERDDSEYHFTVITRTAETPDAAATLSAITAQKPAGLMFDHVVSDAPLINEGTLTIDDVAVSIDTATLADVT